MTRSEVLCVKAKETYRRERLVFPIQGVRKQKIIQMNIQYNSAVVHTMKKHKAWLRRGEWRRDRSALADKVICYSQPLRICHTGGLDNCCLLLSLGPLYWPGCLVSSLQPEGPGGMISAGGISDPKAAQMALPSGADLLPTVGPGFSSRLSEWIHLISNIWKSCNCWLLSSIKAPLFSPDQGLGWGHSSLPQPVFLNLNLWDPVLGLSFFFPRKHWAPFVNWFTGFNKVQSHGSLKFLFYFSSRKSVYCCSFT